MNNCRTIVNHPVILEEGVRFKMWRYGIVTGQYVTALCRGAVPHHDHTLYSVQSVGNASQDLISQSTNNLTQVSQRQQNCSSMGRKFGTFSLLTWFCNYYSEFKVLTVDPEFGGIIVNS